MLRMLRSLHSSLGDPEVSHDPELSLLVEISQTAMQATQEAGGGRHPSAPLMEYM
jgi:hypothetical protein